MAARSILTSLFMACSAFGCASRPASVSNATVRKAAEARCILFVPGVAGDGPWHDGLRAAAKEVGLTVNVFAWGVPVVFTQNFNDVRVHREAETSLAEAIVACRASSGRVPTLVIAHSAGGGVVLGALKQLPADVVIDRVVLLSPSVSPGYDLTTVLPHVGRLMIYHSAKDTAFLDWRTSTFGTYDNIKTPAAGNRGFAVSSLSAAERAKVEHVVWDETFQSLGNDGGHFGALSRSFVKTRVLMK